MVVDGSTAVLIGTAARFSANQDQINTSGRRTEDSWWRLQGEERRPRASPTPAATRSAKILLVSCMPRSENGLGICTAYIRNIIIMLMIANRVA
jgi:hypothetical protein